MLQCHETKIHLKPCVSPSFPTSFVFQQKVQHSPIPQRNRACATVSLWGRKDSSLSTGPRVLAQSQGPISVFHCLGKEGVLPNSYSSEFTLVYYKELSKKCMTTFKEHNTVRIVTTHIADGFLSLALRAKGWVENPLRRSINKENTQKEYLKKSPRRTTRETLRSKIH